MAREKDPEELQRVQEKKKLKEERKRLKKEEKEQKKEVKRRAKELSEQEAELSDEEEPGGIPVFLVTLIIVAIWIAILCFLVKLDVGGIGSGVLAPIFKNVPVVNKILPSSGGGTSEDGETQEDEYAGYTNLKDAVAQIRVLERELEEAQTKNLSGEETVAELKAEIARLQAFEDAQMDFEAKKVEFYKEVIYADQGPGAEEYKKYYESIDPANAEMLYKEVIQQQAVDNLMKEFAAPYAAMKPKDAAAIFDTMTDDLELVAKILSAMGADDKGKILAQMNEENAARVTKILDPEN